ncbi:Pro-kumamolisin [Colletotrichum navitas]|uniref:tripeptidyl-peptidase II n=1 Tax=Colletotrichum navitas TaxID=681940 RepID=A0AAD8PPU8_9PEZI|nr:Pro-kumamolisin [Colletotrichum navitas]KAK1574209.1 Pro-kumamolisin [Colletotrichum navitas]
MPLSIARRLIVIILWCYLHSPIIPSVSARFTQSSIKERHEVPRGWDLVARAPKDGRMSLHIGLQPESPGQLERHLNEISDPFHERFRQYLSADQVKELMRPSEETIDVVHDWLVDCGISPSSFKFSAGKDWVIVPDLTIAAAERLLQTSYHVYRNADQELVRAVEWSLPLLLHDRIDMIHPTTSFFVTKSPRRWRRSDGKVNTSTPSSLNDAAEAVDDGVAAAEGVDLTNPPVDLTPEQACNTSAVAPICLRALYGTLGYTVQAPETNSMALSNYWGEFNNRSDIRQYLRNYRPEATRAADEFTIANFDGAVNQQEPATQSQLDNRQGREGNLDAQVMLGIGYPTPLLTYSTGGPLPPYNPDPSFPENTNEPFLAWLQHVIAQPELPAVISTSYADTEYTVPPSYARRVCNGFAQLGARGVTVVFGSGDWGVGAPGTCHAPNETALRFVARFPESCPYGTSVAATRGINPQRVAYNERNGFVSGGGFSEYFPRPSYQDIAVSSYIARLDGKHDGLYNPHGRAYPDVAAMGYRIMTVWNGTTRVVDGTSASAPIFAAVVALVNDALIAKGEPTLGFLNPWLYAGGGAKAFRDITVGSAKGCDTDGFPAVEGWDAASGFGTPWFPDFKEHALKWGFRSIRPWYIVD